MQVKQQLSLPWDVVPVNSLIEKKAEHNASLTWSIHLKKTAAAEAAGLIVMTTDGRNGFLDALRGSHSERVLHAAACPLLTIPVGSLAGGALTL